MAPTTDAPVIVVLPSEEDGMVAMHVYFVITWLVHCVLFNSCQVQGVL
jgi:hypothetical protein